MVFANKKDISQCRIHIDKLPIERVFVTKFLDVLIDEKLTRKEHIKFVITKIKRSMAMLFKIKDKLNQDSLLTIQGGGDSNSWGTAIRRFLLYLN